jgi:hypothetical protein
MTNTEHLVRMVPPVATTECSHGEEIYTIRDDGTISVPSEAVGPLTKTGGFTLAPPVKDADKIAAIARLVQSLQPHKRDVLNRALADLCAPTGPTTPVPQPRLSIPTPPPAPDA